MEYKLAVGDTPAALEQQVNMMLRHNEWQLYGNVAVTVNSVTGEEMFVQALVRG